MVWSCRRCVLLSSWFVLGGVVLQVMAGAALASQLQRSLAQQSIDSPLAAYLRSSDTREQYVQQMMQLLRNYGTNRLFIDEATIAAAPKEMARNSIAQQVREVLMMDGDLDGVVTSEEIAAFATGTGRDSEFMSQYTALDLNKDGRIDYEEMRHVDGRGSGDEFVTKILKTLLSLDPNSDGKLTADELETYARTTFAEADTDGNGLISETERKVLTDAIRTLPEKTARQPEQMLPADLLKSLPAETEMHVVGVYESAKRDGNGVGIVNVSIERTGKPIVLVLGSYEQVDWRLSMSPGVDLKAVVLAGFEVSQVISLPSGVPVFKSTEWSIYEPSNDKIEAMEETLSPAGAKLASWQGTYSGDSFNITNDFASQPQKAYSWPESSALPPGAEIQVLSVGRGKQISPGSWPRWAMGHAVSPASVPAQVVDVRLEASAKPTILILSAPEPTIWRFDGPPSESLVGVVLAGPSLQYLDAKMSGPVVMWPWRQAGLHGSEEYSELAELAAKTFRIPVTGYTWARQPEEPVVIKAGAHFPTAEEMAQQDELVHLPADATAWKVAGDFTYKVAEACDVLNAAAWGAGGAGGSWSSEANYGGGGAFAYSKLRGLGGKQIKIIVGGGGKPGSHLSNANGERVLPSPGPGGYPDGGDGGTGYDATGGGGGGASRVLLDDLSLLIAGGGGGACGHDCYPGLGGGTDVYFATSSGASGQDGKGGAAGKTPDWNPEHDPLRPAGAGDEEEGGQGGSGTRKGGGGGGGGYGGGGGGAPHYHFPGSGGGGGSKGEVLDSGADRRTREENSGQLIEGKSPGLPGNPEQSGDAGHGGAPKQSGQDGKVVVWCSGM